MNKNIKNNDEIELGALFFNIWKKKFTICIFIIIALVFVVVFELKQKPSKIVATTKINPISIYEEGKYKIYNSFTKNINHYDSGSLKIIINPSPSSNEDQYLLDRVSSPLNLDIKKGLEINNITKKFLFNSFIERLKEKSNLVSLIKKFKLIKKENYSDLATYEDAVSDLASSINIIKTTEDGEDLKNLYQVAIQYESYNLENWEEFLEYIEKDINVVIQTKLNQLFTSYLNYVRKLKQYEIEDVNMEISVALSDNERVLLEKKKRILLENKYIERMQNIFLGSPITKTNDFYAARIMHDETKYYKKNKISLLKLLMIAGIFGTLIGIFYVIIANAIQNRS